MPENFILFSHALAGPDRGQRLDETTLLRALAADEPAWVHLDGTQPEALDWITHQLDYLDPQAIESLLDVDTRPRLTVLGEGLLINLRSTNPGDTPEDMVSIRMWIDAHRIVTISRRNVAEIGAMDQRMRTDEAPTSAGEFLVYLIEDIVGSLASFQKQLDGIAVELETQVISEAGGQLRRDIVDLRLQIITLRRFLDPQRDAMARIVKAPVPFFDQMINRELEEEHLKLTRVIEDLDELRDKTAVLREELSGQLSDRLNGHMFLLSVLSAIFLPLGFLTGLFGVNLAGMPGTDHPLAFAILCGAMVLLFVVQLLLLYTLRWIARRGGL